MKLGTKSKTIKVCTARGKFHGYALQVMCAETGQVADKIKLPKALGDRLVGAARKMGCQPDEVIGLAAVRRLLMGNAGQRPVAAQAGAHQIPRETFIKWPVLQYDAFDGHEELRQSPQGQLYLTPGPGCLRPTSIALTRAQARLWLVRNCLPDEFLGDFEQLEALAATAETPANTH